MRGTEKMGSRSDTGPHFLSSRSAAGTQKIEFPERSGNSQKLRSWSAPGTLRRIHLPDFPTTVWGLQSLKNLFSDYQGEGA